MPLLDDIAHPRRIHRRPPRNLLLAPFVLLFAWACAQALVPRGPSPHAALTRVAAAR